MKKILFTLLLGFITVVCNGQNSVSQIQSTDSINLKLTELQDKYNFMFCDYELFKVKSNLEYLGQGLSIKTNDILCNFYHSKYDRELYVAYSVNYDASVFSFNSTKELYKEVKKTVVLMAAISNFTDTQLSLINAHFRAIDSSIAMVEASLKTYEVALKMYNAKNRMTL